jgi:16S rRNA (cytidine1402-2'-O)-methyltransferase
LEKIIDILKSKKIVSLISDAGTPTISDPGRILVKECVKNRIEIYPIPGASAVTSAVSISGFSDQYYFLGFLPEREKEIQKQLDILSNLNCSIIFFISAKKINKIIKPLKIFFLNREIVICREISKFYEEFIRTRVDQLQPFEKNLKGELTIVISEKNNNKNISNKLSESDKKYIRKMIKNLTIKDITNLISSNRNISKKEIYNYCLKLKNEK